ncbi:MAG: 4Fe-4S dicluster domain-containing protein [Desulfobacterales bacterium]|nr:4Fe-4S dicluster domain-containing protein [Desulfobacterales bacterium]
MEKMLLVNPDLCTGCNRCAYVCSGTKEDQFQPSKSRIHINNFSANGYSVPSVCFHCPQPDCMKACPEEAIIVENGVVLVDEDFCTGCGECVKHCPYGMIALGEDNLAFKCDLCGGDPSCVKECEFGAIVFQEPEDELKALRLNQMKQRTESGTPEEKRNMLGKNIMAEARG